MAGSTADLTLPPESAPPLARPLDRDTTIRILASACMLKLCPEPGKPSGALTGKDIDVLEALLEFYNAPGEAGFPSYESIAKKAHCAYSTVCKAIKALEEAGLLIRQNGQRLFARPAQIPLAVAIEMVEDREHRLLQGA
jgi:biotin operon repressor